MIYLLDPQVLEQTVNASPLPADETARALLSAPGVAVASSSIPALRALLKKNGICGTPIKKVLQGTKIVKTPSYIDFDDELAETDLEKYLIALAAQSVGGYFITRDEHALRICPWAVSPDRPLPSGDKLQFCDLKRQHTLLYAEVEKKIDDVLRHGQFIQGPEVKELEARCAEFTGSRHAIAVATGTDALLLALMAYDVAPGDYVITTPFTFISTAEVISLLGATPLFVDVERDTYNICPQALRALVETPTDPATGKAISADKLRGAIAVDIFGQPADYDALRGVLQEKGLFLIEDGAQSFGAQYKGKRACALGDISTTSFFPAKPLGCYGDGGMMFTDDDALAAKIRSLLNHGQTKRYHHSLIGINGRLDTLQAAILLAKFDRFVKTEIEERNTVARWYADDLQALAAEGKVTLPTVAEHADGTTTSVWAQFSILVKERDTLRARLEEAGIPTAVHYPVPLHLQEAFAPLNYPRGAFPVSERIAATIISLPMDPWKTREEIRQVAEAVIALL